MSIEMRTEPAALASNPSYPVGFAVAVVATALSQLGTHLWLYGRDPERFHPLRFFGAPALVLGIALLIAIAWLATTLVLRRRAGQRMRIGTRPALLCAVLGALLVNTAATFSFLEFDPYRYWAVVAIVVGVPAFAFSVAIAAILVLLVVPAAGRSSPSDVGYPG
jgi:hypothetical protein